MKYVSVATLEKILNGLYDRMDLIDEKAKNIKQSATKISPNFVPKTVPKAV